MRSRFDGDHPRVCGEHLVELFRHLAGLGSSPRMRGTRIDDKHSRRLPGIITAYAGNTVPDSSYLRMARDHPRVCGEHPIDVHESGEQCGSSPRMRGTRGTATPAVRTIGIIPAYAGNTPAHGMWTQHQWDHPRVCGEHNRLPPGVDGWRGSSPRMRGTR